MAILDPSLAATIPDPADLLAARQGDRAAIARLKAFHGRGRSQSRAQSRSQEQSTTQSSDISSVSFVPFHPSLKRRLKRLDRMGAHAALAAPQPKMWIVVFVMSLLFAPLLLLLIALFLLLIAIMTMASLTFLVCLAGGDPQDIPARCALSGEPAGFIRRERLRISPEVIGIAVVVVAAIWMIAAFNGLVALRTRVQTAWAQIDVQLKRRHDLIPNLVEAVRGYMQYERSTLEAVTQARAHAMAAGGNVEQRSAAEAALTAAIGRLFAVVENYPQLRAVENVQMLQEQITSTENRIAYARQFYNDEVMKYNTLAGNFPPESLCWNVGFFPVSDVHGSGLGPGQRASKDLGKGLKRPAAALSVRANADGLEKTIPLLFPISALSIPRIIAAAVRIPCLREFCDDFAFPRTVFGPVDLRAFFRFAASCFSVIVFSSVLRRYIPSFTPRLGQ